MVDDPIGRARADEPAVLSVPARRHKRDARRKTNRKRALVIAAVAVALLVFAAAVWAYIDYRAMSNDLKLSAEVRKAVEQQLSPAPSPKEPVYLLILGLDKRPKEKYGRTDTILLARLDPKTKTVKLLSIPRDSRVPVEGHGLDKINAAGAYGGPALAIKTVKDFTGLLVNHYLEIDFQGFADVVNAMGGVRIDVDRSFDDINGANTGGVSNVTHIDKGYQKLNGQQSLTYVRARHPFADGDFTRMKHQQTFIAAVAKQSLSAANLPKLPSVARAASTNMKSDMSLGDLIALVSEFRGVGKDSIKSYTLPSHPAMIGGISYMLTDTANAKLLIGDFRNGRDSKVKPY